jgi:diguanylate cyclase (GGDEF)-like protein
MSRREQPRERDAVRPGVDTILVVEDDVASRVALADLLEDEGYRVLTAGDANQALAVVEREAPLLIVSDVRMPNGDGLELVSRLRNKMGSQIRIVLVSAHDDREHRLAGLELGADDFLAKPVDPEELLARIHGQVRRARRERELARYAAHDPLTGVLNRRGIHTVLRREVDRVRAAGVDLSILLVDVDHFKALNDRYGHAVGDTVLRQIAAHLTRNLRLGDHVGRIGGDEFVVSLPGVTAGAAAVLAERIRTLRLTLFGENDGNIEVTVSAGIATLGSSDTVDSLIERADQRMYRVKRDSAPPPAVG